VLVVESMQSFLSCLLLDVRVVSALLSCFALVNQLHVLHILCWNVHKTAS